jgi:hypothetical protein
MRINFRNVLSIVAAMLLLFAFVVPARAGAPAPVAGQNNPIDDAPLPPNEEPVVDPNMPNAGGMQQPNLAAVINVWHGNGETFGSRGTPQKQINIVGNISGASVTSMTFKLNNGPTTPTSVGTGSPRLENPGDFNIVIDIADPNLNVGTNTLLLTAAGVSRTVNFSYVNNVTAHLPYLVDWSSYSSITQTGIVVDGRWNLTSAGPRTAITGYDRIIALGQRTWTDYEVTVPITVHSWPVPGDGGVGIIARWDGHSGQYPLPSGWSDMGAYGYYSNDEVPSRAGLAMWLNGTTRVSTGIDKFEMAVGVPYIFKLRVETVTSTSARYSLKAWQQGQPEPAWDSATFSRVYQVVDTNDKPRGGVLLVAHYADATFGDVLVTQIPTNNTLDKKIFIPLARR